MAQIGQYEANLFRRKGQAQQGTPLAGRRGHADRIGVTLFGLDLEGKVTVLHPGTTMLQNPKEPTVLPETLVRPLGEPRKDPAKA